MPIRSPIAWLWWLGTSASTLRPLAEPQRVEDLGAAERLVHAPRPAAGWRRRARCRRGAAARRRRCPGRATRRRRSTPSSISTLRVRCARVPAGTRPGRRSRRRSGSPAGGRGCRRCPTARSRPSCMTPISSAIANASCWSCVTRTAVVPLRLDDRRAPRATAARAGRRRGWRTARRAAAAPGCGASARASATRCCWPPDSSCGYLSRAPPRPTASSISGDARARAPRRQRRQPEADVVARP